MAISQCPDCKGRGYVHTSVGIKVCQCQRERLLTVYLSKAIKPDALFKPSYELLPESSILPSNADTYGHIFYMLARYFPHQFLWLTWDSLITCWMGRSAEFDSFKSISSSCELLIIEFGQQQFVMNHSDEIIADFIASLIHSGHVVILLVSSSGALKQYPKIASLLKKRSFKDPKDCLSFLDKQNAK